jgi:hypothetical protein
MRSPSVAGLGRLSGFSPGAPLLRGAGHGKGRIVARLFFGLDGTCCFDLLDWRKEQARLARRPRIGRLFPVQSVHIVLIT